MGLGSARYRSAASAGSLRALSMVMRAAVGLVFAKLLGAAEVGSFFLAAAVAGFAALVARGGLERLALAEVGRHPHAAGRIAAWLGRHVVGSSVVITAIGVLIVAFGPRLAGLERSVLVFGMLAIVPLNVSQLTANVLRGRRLVAPAVMVGDLLAPAVRMAVFLALPMAMTAARATLAFLIAWAVSAGVGVVATARMDGGPRAGRPSAVTGVGPWSTERPWRQARPLLAFSLVSQLRETFTTGFGWAIGTPVDVGALGTASRIEQMSLLPTTATRFVTAPDLVSQGDRLSTVTAGFAARSARKSTAVQLPFLVAVWALAPRLLELLGDDFASATGFVRILLIGSAVNALTGSTTQLLLMSDHRRELARSSAAGLVLLVVLSVGLAPALGVTAIAVGLAAAHAAIGAIEWWMVRDRLGARADVFAAGPPRRSVRS